MRYSAICLLLVQVAALPLSAHSQDYDNGGFESPDFTIGSLDNQQGWKVVDLGGRADDAVVQDKVFEEGTQAVLLKNTDQRVLIRKPLKNNGEQWIDVHLLAPPGAAILANLSLNLRGRDGEGHDGVLLSISFDGADKIVSFNEAGGINNVPPSPNNRYRKADWNRLTLHVQPDSACYNLYLNGNLIGEALPFRKTVASIESYEVDWTGSSVLPDANPVVDHFSVTEQSPLTP